jgi:hypothetical protein
MAREYLQAQILAALQRAGAMVPLAFLGGTSLRFLHGIARYSEHLDFALEQRRSLYDFRLYLRAVRTNLQAAGYEADLRVNDRRVVNSAFVRFPGLLYELGLSPNANEILAVKIEVDTNPPAGAGLATTTVRRHALLRLHHHDRASLLAGKLHAVLQRSYTKGRDLYDLVWYLADRDWPEPNLTLLNSGLEQSGFDGPALTQATWRGVVAQRLDETDWARALADVAPFLERSEELEFLEHDHVLGLLMGGQ